MIARSQSAATADLTSDRLLIAIVLGVATRRERTKRKDRTGLLIDEVVETLRDGALNPNLIRYRPGGFDPTDASRRRTCAEALATVERIAPLAHAIADLGA